jgi:hypothetical protein
MNMKKLVMLGLILLAFPVYGAQKLKQGPFICENNRYEPVPITVSQHPGKAKKIVLKLSGKDRILHRVPTQTGALRYEGAISRLTYIQTPSHSVLLDGKSMKALLTDCRQ